MNSLLLGPRVHTECGLTTDLCPAMQRPVAESASTAAVAAAVVVQPAAPSPPSPAPPSVLQPSAVYRSSDTPPPLLQSGSSQSRSVVCSRRRHSVSVSRRSLLLLVRSPSEPSRSHCMPLFPAQHKYIHATDVLYGSNRGIAISCEIPRRYRDIIVEFHNPFAGSVPSCSSSLSARILTTSVSPFLLLHGSCFCDGSSRPVCSTSSLLLLVCVSFTITGQP